MADINNLSDAKPQYENITIETYDQAIKDWFDLTVDVKVTQPSNEELKKVPVVISAGERWVTSRSKKGMRDSNGVLILPMISLRRTAISPDSKMKALGVETENIQVSKKISQKTGQLHSDSLTRAPAYAIPDKAVVYEVTTIPFPDRGQITYELVVQAQYIDQMNKILEKIFHELDLQKSFVAPFYNNHRHPPIGVAFDDRGNEKNKLQGAYAVGYFESDLSDSGNFEEFTDQERIVRWSTSFTVPYALQLDPEGEKPSVQVERTIFAIVFSEEVSGYVDNPADLEKIFGPSKK